ncbi:probable FUN12-general translation factor eIF2 homolog [Fusarium fujikuroi]|nr:probable FUN12-general translation factor eIF2 homolog [Fusarium fujikuroi]SCO54961.1 probable FUN12-general translation factor eIF2 homolog [Fusarium fujikuroi]
MAFQSSVLRDGEWVTQTVNFQDALNASSTTPKAASDPSLKAPECGILSRTVVESPVVHWILPVCLRLRSHNDIAFIGDRFVQISELRDDGQVHEVIRKADFGTRIRNAIVLGGPPKGDIPDAAAASTKTEGADVPMKDVAEASEAKEAKEASEASEGEEGKVAKGAKGAKEAKEAKEKRALPPQLLVLMLETGDAVFLFIQELFDGTLRFETTTFESPRNLQFLGYHLSIDPSSRYMSAGSAEGGFIVYELESLSHMKSQYEDGGSLKPVKSTRVRITQGVIHKMEFLYPRPEDDYHIILLLIIVRREVSKQAHVSRMVVYDWELGDELTAVFRSEKGTPLPKEHRMPLMIIPLKVNTAFLAVSEHSIGIVKNAFTGQTSFDTLETHSPQQTKLHHGAAEPLWTTWARPFRINIYLEKMDVIYLAREDGVIAHIEIDSRDLVPTVMTLGTISTNITTAFTTAYDVFSDVLITGGDSGPGGIWKVLIPRKDPQQVSIIPNWSPVVDLVTTDTNISWRSNSRRKDLSTKRKVSSNSRPKSDRIFCTSGRGPRSSLTELRWGIQARIGLEFDHDQHVRQSWMFPVEAQGERGFYVILSLPHSTDVLHFPADLSNANALSPEACPFDTSSRTISACQTEQTVIIQVSETSTSRYNHGEVCGNPLLLAEHACCTDDIVVISSNGASASQLDVLLVDQMNLKHSTSINAKGEITCIGLFKTSAQTYIIAGSVTEGLPLLTIYSLAGLEISSNAPQPDLVTPDQKGHSHMEAYTSVLAIHDTAEKVILVLGTRSGHLVTILIPGEDIAHYSLSIEQIGISPTNVFPASSLFDGKQAFFTCCDNSLSIMTDFSPKGSRFKTKTRIWATDSNEPSMSSPPVHAAFGLQGSLSGYERHMSLMLLSGTRVLLVDIWPHVGPVPRNILLGGTPMRVIYSQTWKVLVVAHLKDDRPTLSFIDPESGANVATAANKDKQPSDFISGLGHLGDRIFGLYEWTYVKDGKHFPFIIVTTQHGRLMIVSVTAVKPESDDCPTRKLQFWTRYKKKGFAEPIYTVVGDDVGLLFCVGKVLHWEVLDLAEKKLKPMKQFRLDSPATTLRVEGTKVCVLTAQHSLQVIDLNVESESSDPSIIHSDRVTRFTGHVIEMGDSEEEPGKWPVSLISTAQAGFAGVWIPWSQRHKEFEVVVAGLLPTSIRRFRKGHTRPFWSAVDRQKRYNTLFSTADQADILGVSIDGSLHQFSLIGLDLWRFLRLIQNLAYQDKEICPFVRNSYSSGASDLGMDLDPELEPRRAREMMHIDGDLLQRCLDMSALEKLVLIGDGIDLFCEYLDGIDDGIYTEGFRETGSQGRKKYIELGYEILEYVLALAI